MRGRGGGLAGLVDPNLIVQLLTFANEPIKVLREIHVLETGVHFVREASFQLFEQGFLVPAEFYSVPLELRIVRGEFAVGLFEFPELPGGVFLAGGFVERAFQDLDEFFHRLEVDVGGFDAVADPVGRNSPEAADRIA
jgi:hypothetical protein